MEIPQQKYAFIGKFDDNFVQPELTLRLLVNGQNKLKCTRSRLLLLRINLCLLRPFILKPVGIEEIKSSNEVTYYKYTFDSESERVTSTSNEISEIIDTGQPFATFPRNPKSKINTPIPKEPRESIFNPKKITDISFTKWSPKSRKVGFENVIKVKSYVPEANKIPRTDGLQSG